MRNLLKGSRFECKRDSLDVGSIEELYGPSVAVPSKWEESPGRTKPVENSSILRIGGDEFYNMLLRKEGSLRQSSMSFYRTVAHGNVPFGWEDEPGKPKTPAREEKCSTLAPPLSPPPFFQSPRYTNSSNTVQRPWKTTPKRLAKKMIKSIFQRMFLGVSKSNTKGNWEHRSHDQSVDYFDSASLGSDELGVSESISRNGSSSFKSSSVDNNSEFSNEEAAYRISDLTPGCPTPLARNASRFRNCVNNKKSSLFDLKNAYISAVTRMGFLSEKKSSVVIGNEESLHQDGGLEFQERI